MNDQTMTKMSLDNTLRPGTNRRVGSIALRAAGR